MMYNIQLFDRWHNLFHANKSKQPKGRSTRIPLCATKGVAALHSRGCWQIYEIVIPGSVAKDYFPVCRLKCTTTGRSHLLVIYEFVYEEWAMSFASFLREVENCRQPEKKFFLILLLLCTYLSFLIQSYLSWNIVIFASKI